MHSSASITLTKGGTVHIDKDLVAASATPLVLSILTESESYGYAILKRVRELSDGELEWTDGMLYPLAPSSPPARLREHGVAHSSPGSPPQVLRDHRGGPSCLAEQQRQWKTVTAP